MSSNEEDYQDGENYHGTKKRRIQRACDICRRKKSMSPPVLFSSVRLIVFHLQSDVRVIHCCFEIPGFHPLSLAGDGVQMPGNRCSNCISYSLDCTYVEAAKVRSIRLESLCNLMKVGRNADRPRGKSAYGSPATALLMKGAISRYVEGLENRLQKMEKLLRRVRVLSLSESPLS